MKEENLQKVADADAAHLKEQPFGYAINLVMDYGSGRQVTISGTLPLNATLKDFNHKLDMLRVATNRQQAFVLRRDCEAKMKAEAKLAVALEKLLADYEKSMADEIKRITDDPTSQSGNSGKIRSQISAQLENMRTQAFNFKTQKQQEIDQHKTNASIHEVTIASIDKEIEALDNEG